MPKNRDFNHSFDVQHVSVSQVLLKLQAKTSKNNIFIFYNFVKKNLKMLHVSFNFDCLQNGTNKTVKT